MHGYVPPTNAHAADIRNSPYRQDGEKPECWQVRKDDGAGQPLRFPRCLWCGSMTPQLFVELIDKGAKLDVADWKYGYPHKVYVLTPNPQPDELRECGSTSEGSEQRYNERGAMTHRVKTREEAPAGFPEWSDRCGWHYKSKYETLHLKFYLAHLEDLPDLEQHADKIFKATGIYFFRRDGKLMYSGKRPPEGHG